MSLLHEMYSPKALSPSTELALPIGPNDMVLTVIDASVLPAGPNVLTLGDDETAETVLYSAVDGNTVTVAERGFDGTTAKDWPAGTPVARLLTAQDIAALQDNVRDLAGRSSDGKRVARFTVGTSVAGWTAVDCDYLCDGTDDQVEINAALNALPAHGGEVVILDGTYNITAPILIPKDNVSLQGNGAATVLKRMFDGDPDWENPSGTVELRSRQRCKVSKLTFDGNGDVYDGGRNVGVMLENSSFNEIVENTSQNHEAEGIYLQGSSNNTLAGNTSNNNDRGIYLVDSSNNMLIGNTCNNNYYGIDLWDSSNDNIVTGNTCNNNNSLGISLSHVSDNIVTGNMCNNGYSGVDLWDSSNCMVTGNMCNNNHRGVALNYSSNNTVTGNTANNNEQAGIWLYASLNNTVTGNVSLRGNGDSSDYTGSQYTIFLFSEENEYNLVAMNNCMGKAPVVEGGTGNSVYGNKHDAGDDLP